MVCPEYLPVNGVDEMNARTGEAGDRLVASAANARYVLGDESLHLLTCSRAVEQNGTPALTVSHLPIFYP